MAKTITLKPCKRLTLKKGKVNYFPVEKINKKGKVTQSMAPGGYRITLSDDSWVTIIKRDGIQKYSLNRPGSMIMDWANRPTGEREKSTQTFPSSKWEVFEDRFKRVPGMIEAILQGIEQADAEAAERRLAGRAA